MPAGLSTVPEAIQNYANKFLDIAPGADPTNDRMTEAFEHCALPANPKHYPAIRRAIEEIRREESMRLLREWLSEDDTVFSVERTPQIYSYYRIADHAGKPWMQNLSVHISRVTHYRLTEHRPTGGNYALRTHYPDDPIHDVARLLFDDYTALRAERV